MWERLIEPRRWARKPVIPLGILWGALPVPDVIGLIGTSFLCVFVKPYSVGILGRCVMSVDHFLSPFWIRFLWVLLNCCVSG